MEGARRSRLVLGEGHEGGCVWGGAEGFHDGIAALLIGPLEFVSFLFLWELELLWLRQEIKGKGAVDDLGEFEAGGGAFPLWA